MSKFSALRMPKVEVDENKQLPSITINEFDVFLFNQMSKSFTGRQLSREAGSSLQSADSAPHIPASAPALTAGVSRSCSVFFFLHFLHTVILRVDKNVSFTMPFVPSSETLMVEH